MWLSSGARMLRQLFEQQTRSRALLGQATEINAVLDSGLSAIREFQLARIRAICSHANKHTQFYRQRFATLGICQFDDLSWDEFRAIPVLTKETVREEMRSLMSDAFAPDELRKTATGGTTHSPTTLYIEWEAYQRRWAATQEWDRRIGYSRRQRIAYLWGASQDFAAGSWKHALKQHLWSRARFYSASPLDDQRMEQHFLALKRWRPRLLQAYPSSLTIFADYLLRTRRTLRIPVVSVTAEPLQAGQAEIIERAFGVYPFNWYGAREVGRIATECDRHDGMHINCFGVYVEIGPALDSGSAERILVTDLWNRAMPLIRYDIGDLGSISGEPCPCGSALPRIVELQGRMTDVFFNSAGRQIPGVAFTNRFVTDCDEIREMQIEQLAIGKFQIHVVPGARWNSSQSVVAITTKLQEFMQEPTETQVLLVQSIPREPSGKVLFCKNRISRSGVVAHASTPTD